MRNLVNPQQIRLFDSFDSILTEKTLKRLLDGWQGVFRHVLLALIPVEQMSEHFDPTQGQPTKELYSMAGLLLIQKFMNWTRFETLDAYSFHTDIQYALNLEPVAQDLSMRTLDGSSIRNYNVLAAIWRISTTPCRRLNNTFGGGINICLPLSPGGA